MKIPRRYVVDEHNRRVAVQLDLETFGKIEDLLENHALARLMEDAADDDLLDLASARSYYQSLEKPD